MIVQQAREREKDDPTGKTERSQEDREEMEQLRLTLQSTITECEALKNERNDLKESKGWCKAAYFEKISELQFAVR